VRKSLLENRLIIQKSFNRTGAGTIKLFDLLPQAFQVLDVAEESGIGRGGQLHQYFCQAIEKKMIKNGYKSLGIDRKFNDSYNPDITLERDGKTTLVEVALSSSSDDREVEHVFSGIKAGADFMVLAFDKTASMKRIKKNVMKSNKVPLDRLTFCLIGDMLYSLEYTIDNEKTVIGPDHGVDWYYVERILKMMQLSRIRQNPSPYLPPRLPPRQRH